MQCTNRQTHIIYRLLFIFMIFSECLIFLDMTDMMIFILENKLYVKYIKLKERFLIEGALNLSTFNLMAVTIINILIDLSLA